MWLQLWQLAKLLLFLATCWNIGFFEIDVLNCMIFCNWLSKCVTASPKIEKIHTFFRIDFLKFAIFVYIGHVNTQLFLWKPVKTACFLRRLLNMHRWAIYIKKVYYVQIYRYSQIFSQNILYTYTLRILENIEYTLVSKNIFNILSKCTLKNH